MVFWNKKIYTAPEMNNLYYSTWYVAFVIFKYLKWKSKLIINIPNYLR